MKISALYAREKGSDLASSSVKLNALTRWMENSTERPRQIRMLTSDTAFNEIPPRTMAPPMLTRIETMFTTRIIEFRNEPRRNELVT
ncbi:hypothetical protein OGATHE_000868 [Ogataea polymorpha]|uniref:Uncharacterized protein n=1 Tax=Ogataea polymorpha TaxID=460523 RepID=A0A9P8PU18_9ASCO|nr:hypothetical protein OGATHE_000868 [Ogataea polymorpha]